MESYITVKDLKEILAKYDDKAELCVSGYASDWGLTVRLDIWDYDKNTGETILEKE